MREREMLPILQRNRSDEVRGFALQAIALLDQIRFVQESRPEVSVCQTLAAILLFGELTVVPDFIVEDPEKLVDLINNNAISRNLGNLEVRNVKQFVSRMYSDRTYGAVIVTDTDQVEVGHVIATRGIWVRSEHTWNKKFITADSYSEDPIRVVSADTLVSQYNKASYIPGTSQKAIMILTY